MLQGTVRYSFGETVRTQLKLYDEGETNLDEDRQMIFEVAHQLEADLHARTIRSKGGTTGKEEGKKGCGEQTRIFEG